MEEAAIFDHTFIQKTQWQLDWTVFNCQIFQLCTTCICWPLNTIILPEATGQLALANFCQV